MAEDRSADRPRRKADEVGAESQQRPGGWIGVREIELAENQSGCRSVKEEVVPFDGGADRGGDHRFAQLAAVVGRGKRVVSGYRSHVPFPLLMSRPVLRGRFFLS